MKHGKGNTINASEPGVAGANGERIKINITLGDYETKLFREACKVGLPALHRWEEDSKDAKRRMIMLMLLGFLRGVIQGGQALISPAIAELRSETEKELNDRVADVVPTAGPSLSLGERVTDFSPAESAKA